MPARSKAQLRMAQAVCRGGKTRKGGISKKAACEIARKTKSTKGLPEKKSKSKRRRK